jgi:hypothetical protein
MVGVEVMQNIPNVPITLGDPVVVSQAPLDTRTWGPWQFPAVQRAPDGRLQIGYHIAADSTTAYGTPPGVAVSGDDGDSWQEVRAAENAPSWTSKTLMLPNGDLLCQVTLKSRNVAEIQDKLPPPLTTLAGSYGAKTVLYLAEKMPRELAGWRFSRLAKGDRTWVEETAQINIPGEVRWVTSERSDGTGGVLVFPWIHRIKIGPDGSLWGYGHSLRVVDGTLQKKTVVQFLHSRDNGRTWDLLNEIPYQPDPSADKSWDKREGFTEPDITFLPDGSVLCLMRTTDGIGIGPLYASRSTDNGKSWSKPSVFDDLGVWPVLLTLENGVTLASYGRTGFYIRATNDAAGKSWDSRITVVNPGQLHTDTCSYSDLIALNRHTALVVYSDFNYPDRQGKPRKTILVRKITSTEERI